MEESKRQRNSGLLDLWEHACLLYHSFEWQSAADTFSHLANVSTDPTDQRTFALNRGLIEARLGDFDLASVSFAKALSLDNDDPIAHFLLGLVSVELDDHSTGYAHFRRTLERLPAGALDNRTRVLDFGLARSAVEEDAQRVLVVLKAGKDKVGKAKAMPLCLHSIPAELIFEAPPRPTATSQAGRTSVDNQVSSTTSRSDARFTRDPKTPVTAKKSNSAVDTASKANIDTAEIGSDGQLPGTSLARPLPPKRLSPRDAQIRDGSTKELARFLRHAGPSGVAEITVDRLYLQRLMQGYNNLSTVPRAHGQAHDSFDTAGLMTPLTGPHDGLESLLDLDIVNRPERGGLSSDAGVQKNVSRKPLPGAVVNLPLAIGK